MHFPKRRPKDEDGTKGFSLIEIVIALAITVFAIMGVIGLLSGALKSNRDSEQRIQAANLSAVLLVQYQAALDGKGDGGGWPSGSVIPESAASSTSASNSYSQPIGVTLQGDRSSGIKADDTAFACSYIVWKSDLGPSAPYALINCALRLQWPPAAAQSNGKSVDHYDTVTSFLVQQ